MAASRRLARGLPALIARHQRLITPTPTPQNTDPDPDTSIPLDPTLPLLPLAVSHLSPPTPLPSLPAAAAASSSSLLRLLRRLRHHPRLAALDLHLLLAAAASSPSFRPDHDLTSHLVGRLAASRRLDGLRALLPVVLSRPCPCSDASIFSCPHLLPTFRSALLAFASSGDIAAASDALSSLRRAADSPVPAEFYNILLRALARIRRHPEAVSFYNQMTSVHRCRPDIYTFNILLNSSCRTEGVDTAMRWFPEMRRWGCEPNGVTFNTLMRGFFRERRFGEGIKVAREMVDVGVGLSVASMEILIGGLSDGGEILVAVDLFIEFLEDGVVPEGFDCLGLVEGLCRAGRVEKALEVAELVFKKKRASCLSVVAGITVLDCLTKAGMLDRACRLMERMVQEGIVPDTISCNCLFEALCEAGRTSDANQLRVLAAKKGFDADGVTFSMLVQGFGREGRRKEGEAVLDEMLDGGFIPNILTYNRLLDVLQKARMTSRMQQKYARTGEAWLQQDHCCS